MRNLKITIRLTAAILFGIVSNAMAVGTWTNLDFPGASGNTRIHGIDGSNIVGDYSDGSTSHGFLYNGTTWTTFDMPGATVLYGTGAYDIDGSNIVGTSGDHGFLYDGTTWTTLVYPGASATWVEGIDGSNIVGEYSDGSTSHGFLYNGTIWTTIDAPGADSIRIHGLNGSNIVGDYRDAYTYHGFLYNGTTWTKLDMPGATVDFGTGAYDIDGSNIVGASDDRGFLYDGTTWTTLVYPGASNTWVQGISGNNIVGTYVDASDNLHSFIYTVPEPATVLLLGLGAVMLRKRK